MGTRRKMSFRQDSTVGVWDSTWLPAVVVHRVQMGCLLVRLEHGVTFSVTVADMVLRDPLAEVATSLLPWLGVARISQDTNKS
jgi:hypothetical protein